MATSSFTLKAQNPDLWGTHITNGLRIGTPATTQTSPGIGTAATLNSNSSLDQFGQGVFTSPIFTYRIRPGQCLNPLTTPDIASAAFAVTTAVPTYSMNLLGPGSQPNAASAKIIYNGRPAILFDVPRCVMFAFADNTAIFNVPVTVYGLDFYHRPKTYSMVCNLTSTPTVFPRQYFSTNTAFSVITDIVIGAFTPLSAAILNLSVYSDNCFGLPYRLDQVAHMLQYSQSDANDSTLISSPQLSSQIGYNVENAIVNYPLGVTTTASGNPLVTPDTVVNNPLVGTGIPNNIVDFHLGRALFANQLPAPISGSSLTQSWGAILAGSPYRSTQTITSTDSCGIFRPNTWIEKTVTPGSSATQLIQLAPNFLPGSTCTFTYYVAGADFFSSQLKAMQNYIVGGDDTTIAKLGFRGYNEVALNNANNPAIFANAQQPPFVSPAAPGATGTQVGFVNGIPDPFNIASSKGATPYYEAPTVFPA